jgi:hypothetical protein
LNQVELSIYRNNEKFDYEQFKSKFSDLIKGLSYPMNKLLEFTRPFTKKDTIGIFPKGKNILNELELIKEKLNYELHDSLTSEEGKILITFYK